MMSITSRKSEAVGMCVCIVLIVVAVLTVYVVPQGQAQAAQDDEPAPEATAPQYTPVEPPQFDLEALRKMQEESQQRYLELRSLIKDKEGKVAQYYLRVEPVEWPQFDLGALRKMQEESQQRALEILSLIEEPRFTLVEAPQFDLGALRKMQEESPQRYLEVRKLLWQGAEVMTSDSPVGQVVVGVYPWPPDLGEAIVHVRDLGADGLLEGSATAVTGVLLTPGDEGAGSPVAFTPTPSGLFEGKINLTGMGQWRLTLTITRPNQPDQTVPVKIGLGEPEPPISPDS